MAGLIPEDFIAALLERIDIVEVIGGRIELKRAGREYKARCPFHDENTPSFTVSPHKQFYHCFGCGAHGTAIGFVMEYDGLAFPDAVEELAGLAGLEVPRSGGGGGESFAGHDRVLAALSAAADWFRRQLDKHPPARDYLAGRGIDEAAREAFQLGFAPDRWDALTGYLTGQGMQMDDLETAGLVAENEGRRYDRFRDRIMFPIHDRRGRVIAFGGRAMGERGPKYLNSPETPVFHKGRELYRLFQARRGQDKADRLMVVEGYMDALALYQYGFTGAVATLGTSVTPHQAEQMFRAVSEVVFCFDGDRAGRQAAWRGLEAVLPVLKAGREAHFLFLPEGEDPDSLVRRQGAAGWQKLLAAARPLSEFFFDSLSKDLDGDSVDARAHLVARAEPYLEKLPDSPFAALMRDELERRSGYRVAGGAPAAPAPRRTEASSGRLSRVQFAVALLVQDPALAQGVDPERLEVGGPVRGLDFLRHLIDFCRAKPQVSTAVLVEQWRERPEGPHLARLAGRDLQIAPENMSAMFAEQIERIRRQCIETRIRELYAEQARRRGLEPEQVRTLQELLALKAEEPAGE